jgi:hypothetical protein
MKNMHIFFFMFVFVGRAYVSEKLILLFYFILFIFLVARHSVNTSSRKLRVLSTSHHLSASET